MKAKIENNLLKTESGTWKMSEITSVRTIRETAYERTPLSVISCFVFWLILAAFSISWGHIVFTFLVGVLLIYVNHVIFYTVEITLQNCVKPASVFSESCHFDNGRAKERCEEIHQIVEKGLSKDTKV